MTNLVELDIYDTKVSLVHLPKLFKGCQQLLKLSFNLAEKSLDNFKENVMAKESQSTDSWFVVLENLLYIII